MPETEQKTIDKVKALLIFDRLSEHYPDAGSGLSFNNPFQLFVATVLSAQTTDEQVNKITDKLFKVVTDVYQLSEMKPDELIPYIKNCGLYHNKSEYLVKAAKIVVEKHKGKIPRRFEELVQLPGVGRKTANVIISNAYGTPALAVDTHVFRVSNRIGLVSSRNVEMVEEQLKIIIPCSRWIAAHHQLIAHGRKICTARNPKCRQCFLVDLCFLAVERRFTNGL